MARSKRNPPKRRTDLSKSDAVAYFLRLMERSKDRRQGLSTARGAVDASAYRDVLPRLMANPTYRWALVADPFPSTPSRIQRRLALASLDVSREFTWSSEVLRLFIDKLQGFVIKRGEYETLLVNARYEDATSALDEIEAAFGWSNWLVASRIQLLQLSKGLQAQKAFLEDLLAQDISPLLGWLSYYYSLRSEENYSLASIQEVIDDLRINQSMCDYAIYHLNPYAIAQVGEPSHLVTWEELHPIVDRLHAHLVGARLCLSGEISDDFRASIRQSLESLREINEPGIERLLGSSLGDKGTEVFSQYVAGSSATAQEMESSTSEARVAISLQISAGDDLTGESILAQVARCMREMLLPNDSYLRSRQQLQKLALLCGHLSITREISSFIARRDADLVEAEAAPIRRYASFGEAMEELCLPSFVDAAEVYQDGRLPMRTQGVANAVVTALLNQDAESLPTNISPWLRLFYCGHIFLRQGRLEESLSSFLNLSQSEIPYMVCLSKVGQFNCALKLNDAAGAAAQAVNHSLEAPDLFRLYPFPMIARLLAKKSSPIDALMKASVFHFASKHDNTWDAELSDAYENVLSARGLERPSELVGFGANEIELNYLRNICLPRIMEDSTAFDSVEEVENERISICQRLMELDHERANTYANEIKAITRNQKVSALLNHVESSMVYVDTAGVLSVVHDSLAESFERYRILLMSPSIEYQAEQISKMMKGLMSKLREADVKNLAAPPSSEKAGLFEEMRTNFIDAFALHPAYGLDTNLSTSIRHGVIEGHIRAAFVQEQLLSTWDKLANTWSLPEYWREKLAYAPVSEKTEIESAFSRLATKVGEYVKLFRDELLHVRRPDAKRNGLFYFNADVDVIGELAGGVNASTTYEEFAALLIDHGWSLVDRSMVEVKARVRGDLLSGLNASAKTFATALAEVPAARTSGLLTAIARCQTAVQVKNEEIASWFKRPTDFTDTPFEIDLALLVAQKQIENCFTGQPLIVSTSFAVSSKLPGAFLNGFVEISFLMLQNAVKHGGFNAVGRQTPIDVKMYDDGLDIVLEFSNEVWVDLDVEELRVRSENALKRHAANSDLAMATQDAQSGLYKIKRILRFDIRRGYNLEFSTSVETRRFTAKLRISNEGDRHVDLHS